MSNNRVCDRELETDLTTGVNIVFIEESCPNCGDGDVARRVKQREETRAVATPDQPT